MPRTRDELLDHVYGRARQLWWRHRVLPLVSALALVVALIATPLLVNQGGRPKRVVSVSQPTAPSTTTASEPLPNTTTTELVAPTSSVPATTTSTARLTTPTTALVCRNSYDPRCGPFRWDPDPGPNQPTTAQLTYSPAHPRVGEQVFFHLSVTNPDGPANSCSGTTTYGDGPVMKAKCAVLACKTPYGPWMPPARKADTFTFDPPGYSYKAAGTYTVVMDQDAGLDPCDQPPNPYRDPSSASTTITISP